PCEHRGHSSPGSWKRSLASCCVAEGPIARRHLAAAPRGPRWIVATDQYRNQAWAYWYQRPPVPQWPARKPCTALLADGCASTRLGLLPILRRRPHLGLSAPSWGPLSILSRTRFLGM